MMPLKLLFGRDDSFCLDCLQLAQGETLGTQTEGYFQFGEKEQVL